MQDVNDWIALVLLYWAIWYHAKRIMEISKSEGIEDES
jgi:hypothetical protein